MAVKSKSTPAVINVTYERGTTIPTLSDISILVVETDPEYLHYSIVHPNTSVDWLILTGVIDEIQIDLDSPVVTPVLQNLHLLPENFYTGKFIFEVSDTSMGFVTFETVINLTLTGTPPDLIKTDQNNYDLVYNRATDILSGETTVNILNNGGLATLNFTNAEGIFENVSGLTTTFTIEENSSLSLATNPALPLTGAKVIYGTLKKTDGTFLNNFTMTLAVINASELVVTPSSFEFEVQKALNESKSGILKIINPLNLSFTVTYPDWLIFPVDSGSASANLSFSTESSGTLTVGERTGNIVVSYDSKTISVPVKLTVINYISIDGLGTYNFCLDGIILRVFRINELAKSVRIKVNAVFETAEKNIEADFILSLIYVNGKCKTNLGEKIHNYFPRNKKCILSEAPEDDFNNQLEYKPAKITLTVEELNEEFEVLKTETVSDLKLYPGKKPKLFPLFTNHAVRRRVAGSTYIFSYLADLVDPSNITDDALPANPFSLGDVQRIKIEDEEAKITFPKVKTILGTEIITLPDNENVIIGEWQNQNLAKEWFVFTGEYKISNDYSQVMQKSSFTSLNEKFDVTKIQNLLLNTGFILKKEANVIDEIIQSKLIFLKIEDKIYRCFSQSTKMVAEDSTQELIQMEVEFYIVEKDGN